MTNNKTSISKKLLKCNLLTRRAAVDSLLSRQERSKEALPAAIKAFGLLLLPGDTSPPDPLAIAQPGGLAIQLSAGLLGGYAPQTPHYSCGRLIVVEEQGLK